MAVRYFSRNRAALDIAQRFRDPSVQKKRSQLGHDQRPEVQTGTLELGWRGTIPIGRYWRSALVVFFNYGVDTGTVWPCPQT